MAPSPARRLAWAGQTMLSLRRGRGEGSDQSASPAPRRHRRDRHAGDGLGPRPSDDAQFPAGHAHRRAARGDIVGDYEDVWARLRARYGKDRMPRTVNTITGPSRTGDIEQTMELGAHGRAACTSWLCANEATQPAPAPPLPSPRGNCASSARASPARSSCCSTDSRHEAARAARPAGRLAHASVGSQSTQLAEPDRQALRPARALRRPRPARRRQRRCRRRHLPQPRTLKAKLGEDPFDLVICCHVLEHARHPARASGNIERVLRPGGLAYVATPWSQAFHAHRTSEGASRYAD